MKECCRKLNDIIRKRRPILGAVTQDNWTRTFNVECDKCGEKYQLRLLKNDLKLAKEK